MATAPTVPIQWVPEDDLLLKNAVEAGASLEALAKGAVLFSRRYSLRELRERWHSLLYDPDISAQTAAQIFELEISGINHASKFNRAENNSVGSKEVAQKRKHAGIRRKYYAMRKKFRNELFSNSNLGIFEPNPHEFSEQSTDFQKQVMHDGNHLGRSCMIGDAISDHLVLQEDDIDILRHAFQGTIRDISVASRANNAPGGYGLDGDATSSLIEGGNDILEVDIKNRKSPIDENPHNYSVGFEGRQQFNPSNSDGFSSLQTIMFEPNQPHLRHWKRMQDVSASSVPTSMSLQSADRIAEDTIRHDVEDKENSSTVYTSEFADPDSLLNLSNEDEMLEDVDENCAANKCCTDNTGAAVQDSIKGGQENDTAKTEPESVTGAEVVPLISPSATPVVSEVSTSSVRGDQPMNSQSEVDAPSKSTLISDFTGLGGGKICCTLNTEDTEIPCNDDIFLLIHPSTSFGSSTKQPTSMGPMTSAHQKDYEQGLKSSMQGNESAKSSGWPHMVGTQAVHTLVGRTAKTTLHDSRGQTLPPGFATKTIGHSTKGGLQCAIPKQCSNSLVKKEVAGVDLKAATVTDILRSTEAGPSRSQHPESAIDDSELDDVESGIDDDVPYFSDIEAMILEMDLDPYDQDSGIVRQVPSYQYDDTKRAIIRLEQGARSCLRRAMTSHEALAILYGRHLRHYITKPKVLLGRSTDDIGVDIDLRKEGRANKISRRQAIIKMEADGSFFLKNLGKSSVLVNGVAVACGQMLNLSTSCLIDIRGMSFVFEINQDYVRKNLSRYFLKSKGKTGKSDWSAEDES
ncbi:hypothetical protein AAHA92_01001 [Salvia divinorum]|uniref:FHA domain-containing protein n=1 Tax=Salvia divinorum TaxID=28513 RepID=A0ABD1ILZ1_SALDI